ncbi:MAG: hypothetical protein V1865_01415 [bacterium]
MSNQELNSFFKQLTKQQKWGLVALIILGIVIFTMWFIQLKKNIIYPIYGGNNPDDIISQTSSFDEYFDEELELLKKNTDTDEDGLSDWDEENIYNTSPFLPDSDSDGLIDSDEIALGKDPNCPEGEECFGGEVPVDEVTDIKTNDLIMNAESEELTSEEVDAIQQVFGTSPDPATIRGILLESGVSQDQLDQVTDEQLMATFNSLQQE